MPVSKIPLLAIADDIQDPSKHWVSSVAFRRFRRKHSELSNLYWTSMMGSHYISAQNANIGSGEKLSFKEKGFPFKPNVLPLTKEEMDAWLPNYENGIRNSILLMCSGNLESYLKRSIRIYLLVHGYASPSDHFKLNEVGQAIGAPIIKRSTIHLQLKYAESLLSIDFGKHLSVWEKAYKERCTHAHQAGVITDTDHDSIAAYDEDIQTDWTTLRQLMNSTDQIVCTLDQNITTEKYRLIELEFELAIYKAANKLPPKSNLWTFVHSELGCYLPARAQKQRIEKNLY